MSDGVSDQLELGRRAIWTLETHGYRRCDMPACNCGGWHGGHAAQRLREIGEALQEAGIDMNGKTILKGVQELAEPERLDRAATDAYAEGRSDEREIGELMLATLRAIVNCDMAAMRKDFGGDADHQFRLWAQNRARVAIAAATGEPT